MVLVLPPKECCCFLSNIAIHNQWTTEKKNGEKITVVSGDSNGLRLDDGSVVPWSELRPEQLLNKWVKNEAQAISFAWLVGLNEKAEDLAEDLSGRNEEFKTTWRRVIIATSQ